MIRTYAMSAKCCNNNNNGLRTRQKLENKEENNDLDIIENIIDEKDENEALEKDRFNVNRELYNYVKFTKRHPVSVFIGFSFLSMLKSMLFKHCKPGHHCVKKNLFNRIPAIRMIKNYRIKEYFLADLLSGITVNINSIIIPFK